MEILHLLVFRVNQQTQATKLVAILLRIVLHQWVATLLAVVPRCYRRAFLWLEEDFE